MHERSRRAVPTLTPTQSGKDPCHLASTGVVIALLVIASAPSTAQTPSWRKLPEANHPPSESYGWLQDPSGGPIRILHAEKAETWTWTGVRWYESTAAGLPPRFFHAWTYDSGRGVNVIFGGLGKGGRALNDTWEFDGTTWTKGPMSAPLPPARYLASLAYDSTRGVAVLFGGGDPASGALYNDTWEYDGASWAQRAATPPGLTPRANCGMAYDPTRGVIVLVGGYSASNYVQETWEYDGAGWTPGVAPPFQLDGVAATFDPGRGAIVTFGGFQNGASPSNETWTYDGLAWASIAAPPNLVARGISGLTYDPSSGSILLYGGLASPSAIPESLWALDATGWSEIHPSTQDLHRFYAAMAYDAARDRVVAFGGRASKVGGPRNDTWELDGAGWTPGAASPPALTPRSTAAIYDAARQTIVTFGGRTATGLTSETWEYDGSWRQRFPATSPPARWAHDMAYDSTRQRCVMFGGKDPAGPRNDTWEYDGATTTWAQMAAAPATLTPRAYIAMAYDPTRNVTVMYGGLAGTVFGQDEVDETWEYDGATTTWTRVLPSQSPKRVALHRLTYDPDRRVVVLTGGFGLDAAGQGLYLDETWEYDGSWTQSGSMPSAVWGQGAAYDAARQRLVLLGGDNGDGGANFIGSVSASTIERCVYCVSDIIAGGGHGPGIANRVRVFDATGTATTVDFLAYAAGQFGVNVASADIDGPAGGEIVTGPGPGAVYGPQIRGFKRDGTAVGKVNFYAYGTLRYGVNVATGDLDRDGVGEMLSGAGPGAVFGPHVRGWNYDGVALAPLQKVSFFAYATLKYGVNVSSGDVDADLYAELTTGPGPGAVFAPQVRGFDYDGTAVSAIAKINYNAFSTPQYGANLACGDVDDDLYAEIVASPGPGGSTSFPARFVGADYDGGPILPLQGFDVTPASPSSSYGGSLALADLGNEGRYQLVAGAGPDPTAVATVSTYRYFAQTPTGQPGFLAFPYLYGVNPCGGSLGY